jgi:predicted amidohydrolase
VRALLAAITCHKGELDLNLEQHLVAIDTARAHRCDLALLPEMSLTGSVDPTQRPEDAVDLADARIGVVADATRNIECTVLFGVAERSAGDFFISQLVAHDGEIVAVHRKRHLGEDELGFATADESPVIDVAGRRVGVVVCAESTVDHTWDRTVDAGADVVAMCSAPGLYGRRVSVDDWRAGFEWWESAGLADACRHAHRLGVWVAMATQAGSTFDEDFPGIAALVSPAGIVVDRLPDWRPGLLVVDIPQRGE